MIPLNKFSYGKVNELQPGALVWLSYDVLIFLGKDVWLSLPTLHREGAPFKHEYLNAYESVMFLPPEMIEVDWLVANDGNSEVPAGSDQRFISLTDRGMFVSKFIDRGNRVHGWLVASGDLGYFEPDESTLRFRNFKVIVRLAGSDRQLFAFGYD